MNLSLDLWSLARGSRFSLPKAHICIFFMIIRNRTTKFSGSPTGLPNF